MFMGQFRDANIVGCYLLRTRTYPYSTSCQPLSVKSTQISSQTPVPKTYDGWTECCIYAFPDSIRKRTPTTTTKIDINEIALLCHELFKRYQAIHTYKDIHTFTATTTFACTTRRMLQRQPDIKVNSMAHVKKEMKVFYLVPLSAYSGLDCCPIQSNSLI